MQARDKRAAPLPRLVVCLALLGHWLPSPLAGGQFETAIAECARKLRPYSEWRLSSGGTRRFEYATASGGKLVYLGVVHSLDPGDPQFGVIEEIFEQLAPTLVFYEGHETAVASSREEAIRRFGESGLVCFLAAERGAASTSLEPVPGEEVERLVERHSAEQVQLFFLLRDVVRLRDRKGLSRNELERSLVKLLARPTSGFPAPIRTLEELESAFWRHWSYPRRWWEARAEWFSPFYTSARTGGVFTNDVARSSSELRDRHMYETLASAVLEGQTVFAVVGRDHLPMQEPALRCALGGNGS